MTTMKHLRITVMLACVAALSLCFPALALADNLDKAEKEFGITFGQIARVDPSMNIGTFGRDYSDVGSAEYPLVVYAQAGTYTIDGNGLTIPENVIFVADENAVFEAEGALHHMVRLRGSLYGGTFKQYEAKTAIYGYQESYSGLNGWVVNVTIAGNKDGNAGIIMYDHTTGAVVKNCKVDGAKNGIKASEGSEIVEISGNTVTNTGSGQSGSGIDIIHSRVGTISGNTISGSCGHGISTGTNAANETSCEIGSITNNKIKNNRAQGVYIEGNCRVTGSFTGNTITGNKGAGIAMRSNVHDSDGTYSSKHFDTYIRNVENNKIYSNNGSNISVIGKKAKLYFGSGNEVYSSKTSCGLAMSDGAKVYINGSNNKFYKNKTAGSIISSNANLTIKGANNAFTQNSGHGISINKAKLNINGQKAAFSKNAKHGLSITAGGVVTVKGKNMQVASNKANGVNITGAKAKFTCTAAGVKISKNANGISLSSKAKAVLKKTRFDSNKKFGVYVAKGCSCKYSGTNLSKKAGKNRFYKAH